VEFLANLLRVISRRPASVTLRFMGGSLMRPDTALAAYDLLQSAAKKDGVKIIAEAVSSIIGPAAILFLLAESRSIRRTGYLYYPIEARKNREDLAQRMLKDAEAWKTADNDEDETLPDKMAKAHQYELQAIKSIIGKHLTFADLSEAPLTFKKLDELSLLGEVPLADMLRKFAGSSNPEPLITDSPQRQGEKPE